MLKQETVAFLKDWLAWVECGAPDGRPYSRRQGLCLCANDYSYRSGIVGRYIKDDLGSALGDRQYPFGRYDYWSRVRYETQHECPKRLAWVREQIAASEGRYDNA